MATARHPGHLHATSALWSLQIARAELRRLRAASASARLLSAADGLQAWRPGDGRRSSGGHGDPVPTTSGWSSTMPGSWEVRAAEIDTHIEGTLAWLVDRLAAPAASDLDRRLLAAVPRLRPSTAWHLARWVRDEDDLARGLLDRGRRSWPVPGAPACPACGVQLLRVQTEATDTRAWTVVCTRTGCVCAGLGCPCGMTATAAGVEHIWAADYWVPGAWLLAVGRPW